MYKDYFGLEIMPFNTTPDAAFFFESEQHKEALARLKYAIEERKGFVLITGEIGSGKTTVCHTLLSQLDNDVKTALITNTRLTGKELLKAICSEFEISWNKSTHIELIHKLNDFLIEQLTHDNNAVIIIDEAQNLTPKILEEIRLISNLETDKEKLVQIILMGQPELSEKLELQELKQLKQRIVTRFHIYPMTQSECENYIYHRLFIAGVDGKRIFDKDAIYEIFNYSKGIPRLINIICDQSLLHAYSIGRHKIDRNIVSEVIREFEPVHHGINKKVSENYIAPLKDCSNQEANALKPDPVERLTQPSDNLSKEKYSGDSGALKKQGFWSKIFSFNNKNKKKQKNIDEPEGIMIEFADIDLSAISDFYKKFKQYLIGKPAGNKIFIKEEYIDVFADELKKEGIFIELND